MRLRRKSMKGVEEGEVYDYRREGRRCRKRPITIRGRNKRMKLQSRKDDDDDGYDHYDDDDEVTETEGKVARDSRAYVSPKRRCLPTRPHADVTQKTNIDLI
jgi:hypothetical protein